MNFCMQVWLKYAFALFHFVVNFRCLWLQYATLKFSWGQGWLSYLFRSWFYVLSLCMYSFDLSTDGWSIVTLILVIISHIYVQLMFVFHLYIQHSIYICKFMESFNAGGHCLVNLLVKMLFWLSVSLKQVARMYLSDLYASLLLAVVHLPWKKNQVCPLFIWCNTMPVLPDVAFYTIHFSQWLKVPICLTMVWQIYAEIGKGWCI